MIAASKFLKPQAMATIREAFLMKRIVAGIIRLRVGDVGDIGVYCAAPLPAHGILDMSSLYADITGKRETAAKMAVEDFGGEVLAARSRSSSPTISTRPTLLPTLRATCSTTRASR